MAQAGMRPVFVFPRVSESIANAAFPPTQAGHRTCRTIITPKSPNTPPPKPILIHSLTTRRPSRSRDDRRPAASTHLAVREHATPLDGGAALACRLTRALDRPRVNAELPVGHAAHVAPDDYDGGAPPQVGTGTRG